MMIHPVVGSASSSSPAYDSMFIERWPATAVLGGMPRAQAYNFAAQAVMGSAKMVLETGEHPGTLERYGHLHHREAPPLKAVRVLEEEGFRTPQ